MIHSVNPQTLAALYLYIFGGCEDMHEIFKIAESSERYEKLKITSRASTVSNWLKSHKIQTAINEIKQIKTAYENTIIEAERAKIQEGREIENTKPKAPEIAPDEINFLDLDNFLTEANKQANKITDEKERRAWLEMIAKYMSFKDRNDSETTEIKRFYTPIECEKCILYNKCKVCTVSDCPEML